VTYPRDVLNPGMLTDNPLEDEDFGRPRNSDGIGPGSASP
jgi:hypothetical protein